ncbi:18427_t:CDS:2, partial [Gigaspora rosea]
MSRMLIQSNPRSVSARLAALLCSRTGVSMQHNYDKNLDKNEETNFVLT